MGYLLNYSRWSSLSEAAFPFDPEAEYPDPTFGMEKGGVDSSRVMAGGEGGDWGGSMPRALAFAKVAKDFMEEKFGKKKAISSQKRSRVKTASGAVSDHYQGNPAAYAVDIPCNIQQGDLLFDYLMNWFGHPELKSGRWINVIKDGYRYQIGWRVPNHYNHIHIGVKKVGNQPDKVVSGITGTSVPQSVSALLKVGATNDPKVVTILQKALGIQPTGTYDASTSEKVKAFQRVTSDERGRPLQVDGIVGPKTSAAIKSKLGIDIWSGRDDQLSVAKGGEISMPSSIISIPPGVKGPTPIFVFYPGIRVSGKSGREYMPPLIKAAVPDWYSKYVIVFPNEHTTPWESVSADIEKTISQAGIQPKNINVGVFSGSGNSSTSIQRVLSGLSLANFIIMDPWPSDSLVDNVDLIGKKGTKVYMMVNSKSWRRGDALTDLEGAVEAAGGKTVDSNFSHMQIPAESLKAFKSDIESSI